MLPQPAPDFDPFVNHPFEVTMRQLEKLDPKKYASLKLMAEDAVRQAWDDILKRRSEST